MFGSADPHRWLVFFEQSQLVSTCSLEKAVYTFHEFRPSVSFSLLQDSKECSFLVCVCVGVVSLFDADLHRGDGFGVVRVGGAVAV